MPVARFRLALVAGLMTAVAASASVGQEPKAAAAPSFDREAQPILRKRCGSCHNPERPRGELDLTTYASVVAGGASGKVAVPGQPEESPIYTLPAHLEVPHMPPNAPKIPQRELDVIRRWVEGGLLEKPGDSPTTALDAESPAAAPSRANPPAGLIAPEVLRHPTAITALAASRTAPLAAVAGHRQILIFDLTSRKLLGALAFPEGDLFALRFSADGRRLLGAGGTGAESGKAVVFDTQNWGRVASLGDELDAILAADFHPDSSRIVIGGPGRVVKVIASPDGKPVHALRKATDWVTAVGFSPDGLLVGAGDRFGGLFLWEARSGQEFLVLRGHTKGINAIGWIARSDNLVSAGDDGAIRIWDLNDGKAVAKWEAHAGGVLWVDVHPSGRIASSGRDRRIKVWQPDGKLIADLGPLSDQVTRVAWASDGKSLLSGDGAGEVRIWSPESGSYTPLVIPVAAKPPALALVAPMLTPARPFVSSSSASASMSANTPGSADGRGDDLATALDAAGRAASAAHRTLAHLWRMAESRTRAAGRSPAAPGAADRTSQALQAADAALAALRAAQASDPGNAELDRAVEATDRAIRRLRQKSSPSPPNRGPVAGAP